MRRFRRHGSIQNSEIKPANPMAAASAAGAERVVKISDGKIIFDGDVKAYESIL